MDPITVIDGAVSVLDRDDVDTDQIIPKQYLTSIKRTGFAEGLFGAWRQDAQFVLNQPRYRNASVLIARKNFGCGSSREHAPWALEDYGFKAVIAPSFADIFYGNSTKIGLLPIRLPLEDVKAVMAAGRARIDLEAQEVAFDGRTVGFEIDPDTKHRLLNGLDEIGLTLQREDAIAAYEAERERPGPVTTAL